MEQVASCAKSAAAASLANQRDKYLDAQSAWQKLADQAIQTQAGREKRDAEKLAAPEDSLIEPD